METKKLQKRAFRFQEIFAIYRVMVASQMVRFPFLSLRAGNEKRSVEEARGERVVRFLFMGQKWSRMEPPLYGIYGLDSHAPSARGSTRDENEGYTAVSSKQPYLPNKFAHWANRITRPNRNRASARRLDGRALSACPPVEE